MQAASRACTNGEAEADDFQDLEVPPKRRLGHYAKVALRHTERLMTLINQPTRATATIPGPTQKKRDVEARVGAKGRAAAKMAAKAGLRCLVCHAVTGTCDHTRVLGKSSNSAEPVVHVLGCSSSLHDELEICLRLHYERTLRCIDPIQVDVSLHVLRPSSEPGNFMCVSFITAQTRSGRAPPLAEGLSSLTGKDRVGSFAGRLANRCAPCIVMSVTCTVR